MVLQWGTIIGLKRQESYEVNFGFDSVKDLNLDKAEGFLTSTLYSRFLWLKARDTSQNLIFLKSVNQMNPKIVELRQWNSATWSSINISVVFSYKFVSSLKLFYLTRC